MTIGVDDERMADIDRLMASRGYQDRSEAVRDLARAGLRQVAADVPPRAPPCPRHRRRTANPGLRKKA